MVPLEEAISFFLAISGQLSAFSFFSTRSQVVLGNAIMAQAWLGQINYQCRFLTNI
jgi:hypothetical protein